MDTPEKKAQPAPTSSSLLSKFEDSPVFNYINNLSPLTPYNSSRSGHSFQLFGFTSPQSLKKVPNKYQFESETNISDVPKDSGSHNGAGKLIIGTSCSVVPDTVCIEKVGSDSIHELTALEKNEFSKMLIELPKSLKYESGSPENSVAHSDAAGKLDCNLAIEGGSQEADCLSENEMGEHGIPLEVNKQLRNKEKLIYEPSDVLQCRSPAKENHLDKHDDKSVDSGTQFFVATVLQPQDETADRTQKLESIPPPMSCKNQDLEAHFSQSFVGNPNETSLLPASKSRALRAEDQVHYSSTRIDDKMTRSRCLVSQMSGARYRKLISHPADSPPISKPAASSNASNVRGEATGRHGGDKFSSQLPGIGLHLNALAATSREKIIVKRQTLTCRRQLISSPCTTPSFNHLSSDTKPIGSPMSPDITGMSCEDQGDELRVTGNASQDSAFGKGSEFYQDSPNKKRKMSENGGEPDSCKRCNCKRSKCLKLYCVCFAAGLYCVEPCSCQDCFNKPIHEETVLETRRQIESRNPLAFAPKVIRISGTPNVGVELNTTPASARHQRGCNCKKSGCLKKYCECYQGGVGCSVNCRCEGCKNTFGQKEGCQDIIMYEEPHIFSKIGTDASSYDDVFKTDEENEDQATPEPSNNLRRPFHLGGTGSQFPSNLRSCTVLNTEKPDAPAFNEDLNVAPEYESPELFEDLNEDHTLSNYVKSTSPKSKRVSPPHYDFDPSPPWKSCRKLILRSVPSLPTSIPEKKAQELHQELQ